MQKILTVIALLLAAALVGCASTEPHSCACNDRQTLLHAIEGTKLNNLMRRLHNLSFDTKLTEPEIDSQRRQAISLMLSIAEGADNIVSCVLATKPESNLDDDQQALVHSLTGKLRDEAKTLRYQAQVFKFDDIPATLKQMDATCSNCHELLHISTDSAY